MPQKGTAGRVRATADVRIRRSLGEVFSFVCDPRNDPQWIVKVVAVEKITSGPIGIGSIFRQTATLLGGRVNAEWKITEYNVNQCLRGQSTNSPLAFEGGYTFIDEVGVTRVTKDANFDLSRIPAFVPLPIVGNLLRKEFENSFRRLKAILETR